MSQPNTLVVQPNLLRILGLLVVSNIVTAGGLLLIFGLGKILAVVCTAAGGLSIFFFAVAAIRQSPRVVMTPEGFVVQKLFSAESHQWADVDGQFAVIKVGLSKGVAYHLTAEYKTRVGKKPTSLFSGYDAALSGAFNISTEELAELLNEYRGRHPISAAAPGELSSR